MTSSPNFNLGALAFASQNLTVPEITGSTLGFALGTGSTSILPINPQVRKVTFHNPGAANIVYVCPALDANGNPLTPGALGGNYAVYPGGTMIFTGNGAGGAWLASASGASTPLTVTTSQTI